MTGSGRLDYPPPFRAADFIAKPGPPNDLRIDVGVCIVGAGPAGLAAAIRLGQRLGDDPETLERLGEVPIAVLEKGRAVGAHALSGAIVRPQVLGELLPGTADRRHPRASGRCRRSRSTS